MKSLQRSKTTGHTDKGGVTPSSKEEILVTGGTGKTGRRIVQRLSQLGWPVRVGSRSNDIPFDWLDPHTWSAALKDVRQVYIAFQPDLAIPGSTKVIRQLAKAAAESGVKKLVLLSGRGEKEAQDCEEIVMNSGLAWTILRASWFNQNFSEGVFVEQIQAGHLAAPAGDVAEPFIDTDDIADVAVAALTEPGHDGQLYEITGPRLLTFKQAVQEIAQATGRNIAYEQMPVAQYADMLAGYGLSKDIIWLVTYLFSEVLDGRNQSLGDGVQRALGRKPTDFSEYARKAAATGAWG